MVGQAKGKEKEMLKKILVIAGLILVGSGSIFENNSLIVIGTIMSIIAALLILVLK